MNDILTGWKEICQAIGCSGLDPDMCQNRPQNCQVVTNVLQEAAILWADKEFECQRRGTGMDNPVGFMSCCKEAK
jgi:hypothetical protein